MTWGWLTLRHGGYATIARTWGRLTLRHGGYATIARERLEAKALQVFDARESRRLQAQL
jgi:hypothetical protein